MSSELEIAEHGASAPAAAAAEIALPARFSDPHTEWAAVRQRCGVFDARFRGLLRMTGSDRLSFLQGMVTNDVAKLQVGEGTYAALLTQQGRVVSDLRIYVLAEELWLDVPASRVDAVRTALERFIIADDVEFNGLPDLAPPSDQSCPEPGRRGERSTEETPVAGPLVTLEGPQAARVLLAVIGESMADAPLYTHREVRFDGVPLRAVAAGHCGEIGYSLYGPPAVAVKLWEHCHAAGAEPAGMEALNVLRVEAGIPWYGCDMDESMLVSEVGIDSAISYQKGCYLGQEVVERVAARGQVHRKLLGLVCAGPQVPPTEAKLWHDGKEVGWLTSAVWSPARSAVVALGYVRRECWDPGTEVRVIGPAGEVSARIETLPFYSKS